MDWELKKNEIELKKNSWQKGFNDSIKNSLGRKRLT